MVLAPVGRLAHSARMVVAVWMGVGVAGVGRVGVTVGHGGKRRVERRSGRNRYGFSCFHVSLPRHASVSSSLSFASEHDSLSVRQLHGQRAAERPLRRLGHRALAARRHRLRDHRRPAPRRSALAGPSDGAVRGARQWSGICNHFEQVQAEETGLSTYLVRIVPELWLLTQRRNNRIFQHLSVPDIVDDAARRVEHRARVGRSTPRRYPRLEYRVQYGESDFAFVSRLLEEAGITYFFAERRREGHACSSSPTRPRRATRAPAGRVPFVDEPEHRARRASSSPRCAPRARSGPARSRCATSTSAAASLPALRRRRAGAGRRGAARAVPLPRPAPSSPRGTRRRRRQAAHADDEGGRRRSPRAASRPSARRREVRHLRDQRARPRARARSSRSSGHPHDRRSAPHALLVRRAAHRRHARTASGPSRGQAVFADAPYRPAPRHAAAARQRRAERDRGRARRARRSTPTSSAACACSSPGIARARTTSNSSCWMRVSQGWAGAGYGMIVIPRVGQEVLVGFLEGDPDQPGRRRPRLQRAEPACPTSCPTTRRGAPGQQSTRRGGDAATTRSCSRTRRAPSS